MLLPDQMFEILESDHWREDLYLFSTEALPLSANMLQVLGEMTNDQQEQLRTELNQGRVGLENANRQTVGGRRDRAPSCRRHGLHLPREHRRPHPPADQRGRTD